MMLTGYPSRVEAEPEPVERLDPVVYGRADDGPFGADELASYERRGFATIEQLLSPDELLELEAEVERLTRPGTLGEDERVILEPDSGEVRSVFEVHRLSGFIARLAADDRLAGRARQVLGSDVYLHQTRVNCKPGLRGREFYWHSDFETWHHEDGMPAMRALSVSISLTENLACNGSVMIVPGSHKVFVGCAGATPDDHYRSSLRAQQYGVPSDTAITRLVASHGIETVVGPAGSALFFDSNCMHGSNGNITPYPRRNLFLVYNSVENALVEPFGANHPRPDHVAAREVIPL